MAGHSKASDGVRTYMPVKEAGDSSLCPLKALKHRVSQVQPHACGRQVKSFGQGMPGRSSFSLQECLSPSKLCLCSVMQAARAASKGKVSSFSRHQPCSGEKAPLLYTCAYCHPARSCPYEDDDKTQGDAWRRYMLRVCCSHSQHTCKYEALALDSHAAVQKAGVECPVVSPSLRLPRQWKHTWIHSQAQQ